MSGGKFKDFAAENRFIVGVFRVGASHLLK